MIEKDVSANMLEDIQECLNSDNWQGKVISSAKQYKQGLLVSIDPEIKKLVDEYKKYDEDSQEAVELAKQFNVLTEKIYNS